MTMRFTLTLAVQSDSGTAARSIVADVERGALAAETLGLTLAEAKAILAKLQAAIVADQAAAHETTARRCMGCGAARSVRGHRPLTYRTAFGTV